MDKLVLLEERIQHQILQTKNNMHKNHNKVYAERPSTEIEMLNWVLGEILMLREKQIIKPRQIRTANHNIEDEDMIFDGNMSNINYMKELSRLALEVCKRNKNIPICLLKPDLRRQTIIELKGRDDLEQWDKDLIEHGWFTGTRK